MAREIMGVRCRSKMKTRKTLTNNIITTNKKKTNSNTPHHNKSSKQPPRAFANGCRTTMSNPLPLVICQFSN